MNIRDLRNKLQVIKGQMTDARLYANVYGVYSLSSLLEEQDRILEELQDEQKKFDLDVYKKLMINYEMMADRIPELYGSVEALNSSMKAIKDADISGTKSLSQVLRGYTENKDDKLDFVENRFDADALFFVEIHPEMMELGHQQNMLKNSKRGVWGTPSPQFVAMEEAMDQVAEYVKTLNEEGLSEEKRIERYSQYREMLRDLKEKADAYVAYKRKNVSENKLKNKEKRRIEAAESISSFAEKEGKKFSASVYEYTMRTGVLKAAISNRQIVHIDEIENRDNYKSQQIANDVSFAKNNNNKSMDNIVPDIVRGKVGSYDGKGRIRNYDKGTCDIAVTMEMSEAFGLLAGSDSNAPEKFENAVKKLISEPIWDDNIKGYQKLFQNKVDANKDNDVTLRVFSAGGLMSFLNSKTDLDSEFLKVSYMMDSILDSKYKRFETPMEKKEREAETGIQSGKKGKYQIIEVETKINPDMLPENFQTGYYGLKTMREITVSGLLANDKLFNHASSEFTREEKENLLSDLIVYRITDQAMRSMNSEKKEFVTDLNELNPVVKKLGEGKDVEKTQKMLKDFVKNTADFKRLMDIDISKEEMSALCNDYGEKGRSRFERVFELVQGAEIFQTKSKEKEEDRVKINIMDFVEEKPAPKQKRLLAPAPEKDNFEL